jgi:hypothetical protein
MACMPGERLQATRHHLAGARRGARARERDTFTRAARTGRKFVASARVRSGTVRKLIGAVSKDILKLTFAVATDRESRGNPMSDGQSWRLCCPDGQLLFTVFAGAPP